MKFRSTLTLVCLLLCLMLVFLTGCFGVERQLTGIRIDDSQAKTTYTKGETFSTEGLQIFADFSDGTSESVSLSDVTIDTVDTSKTGVISVKVSYQNVSATFVVRIQELPTVSELKLNAENAKTEYIVGEAFDASGLVFTAIWSNGTEETVAFDKLTMSDFSTDTAGKKIVTFTYEEQSIALDITVKEPRTQTDLSIDYSNVKRVYEQHDDLDFSGLIVTAIYNWGGNVELSSEAYSVTGANTESFGTQTVTVTDGNFSKTFTITVSKASIQNISVDTSGISKLVFEKGETVDLTGLVVNIQKKGESLRALTATEYSISDYSNLTVGNNTITVTLLEDPDFSETFNVVVREVTSIVADTTGMTKTGIYIGSKPDYTKMTVTAHRSDGTSFVLSASDYSISGDEPTVPGSYTVTVSYKGLTDTFSVAFVKPPVTMDVFSLPDFVNKFTAATSVASSKEAGYAAAITYRVGNENGFVFKPTAAVMSGQDLIPVESFETAFELYEGQTKLTGEDLTNTVSYNPSSFTYQFTENAVGKTFTLKVAPKNTTKSFEAVSFTFQVVKGWNVYTPADLSRMANSTLTNMVTTSGNTVNEKDAWDAYKLAHGVVKADGNVDDTPISGVVLQNSLVLTDNDLPSLFFVTADEDATGLAVGHLKDITYSYHHILNADETFNMYGNGFSINASAISSVYDDPNHVWGYGSDYSNCNIFKFDGTNTGRTTQGTDKVIVQDLTIIGNAMRTNDMDQLIPDLGGMIAIKYSGCNVTMSNTIITRSFIGSILDLYANATLDGVKVYDSLQDALFIWGGTTVAVNNSIMKRAGGPLIILQHVDPTTDEYAERVPTLTVDANSTLENFVNGQEAWFVNNGATTAAQSIVGLDNILAQAADGYNGALGNYSQPTFTRKSILTAESAIKSGGNPSTYYLNLVTLMMSDGVSVGTAASGAQGKTTIGGVVVSTTLESERIASLRATLSVAIGAQNAAQVVILENSNGSIMWTDGTDMYVVTETNPALKLNDFITAEITDLMTSGGTNPIDTSFFTSGDYLTVHSGGMAIVLHYN